MKKKILMIPDCFPTEEDPVAGSFFKEQAEALSRYFDFFIIRMKFSSGYHHPVFLNGSRQIKITPIETKDPLPEIHCIAYVSFLERLIRFFIRRNCYFGSFMKKILRNLEFQYDRRRCDAYYKIYRHIFKEYAFKPDLIYAMTVQTNGHEAYLLSKRLSIPSVLAEHNPFPFPGTIITESTKTALEGCSAVLSVSNHLSRLILTQGIVCTPIIVGNMVDSDRFLPKKGKNNSRSVINILFVGAYSFFKDYDTFFKAMTHLRGITTTPFRITIVGYDVSKGYSAGEDLFRQHFGQYPLSDISTIIPKTSRSEIVHYYQNAEVFVSTSVQETFGVSCLEALSCGLPVFATKSGGVEDFIDNDCGRLVNLKDFLGLAELLKDFFEHRINFDSEKIRQRVIEKYGIEAFTARIGGVFNSVINCETPGS